MKKIDGKEMDEKSLKEWQQSFKDIEESIENIDIEDEKKNPYAKYKKLKQQNLF